MFFFNGRRGGKGNWMDGWMDGWIWPCVCVCVCVARAVGGSRSCNHASFTLNITQYLNFQVTGFDFGLFG